VLIEDGILKGYIQDAHERPPDGRGPPATAGAKATPMPMPRMTNTYMLGGDKDPKEIVASIKKGLYATNFGGGQVDITSASSSSAASEAYWVENGKISVPGEGRHPVGNGPER
jgi:TldD protein